jgi:hypothetical protein
MKDLAFTTVAVTSKNYGDGYLRQQDTLIDSIRRIYWKPEQAEIFVWRDEYPPGSRDWLTSSYGFKPWAVQYALNQGYKKIVYMDTAMILKKKLPISQYDHLSETYGVLAAKDDSSLTNVTWDMACEYFGVSRDWLVGKNLVGGSFYYFNFDNEKCRTIFEAWKKAEIAGMFGSQDGESAGIQNGHRCDESCMAILLYLHGIGPCSYEQVGYQGETMIKRHFR